MRSSQKVRGRWRRRGLFKSSILLGLCAIGLLSIIFLCSVPQTSGGLGDTSHDPIFIVGNSQFDAAHGVNGGGDGTAGNPYIIENWAINASGTYGINIQFTTAYFIIRNCLIENAVGAYCGIRLYNAPNGRIENNEFDNNYNGIYTYNADNGNIINNVFTRNHYGIYIAGGTSGDNIINNTITSNMYGIYLTSSSSNVLTGNVVSNNKYDIYNTGTTNTYSSNQFNNNMISKMLTLIESTRIENVGDNITFSVWAFNLNGTNLSGGTTVTISPSESSLSYSDSGGTVTGWFTPTRSGTYSLNFTVTDSNSNTTKRRMLFFVGSTTSTTTKYYLRATNPTHGQPYGLGTDVGTFLLTAPVDIEMDNCTEWVQASPDEIPNYPLANLSNIDIYTWYKQSQTSGAYIGIQRYLTYWKNVDDSSPVENVSDYTWTNENFTEVNWAMDYPQYWYWLSVKLSGTNPHWTTFPSLEYENQPSYANFTYSYTTTPIVKSISNPDNILLLSATAPVDDNENATIVLDGTGSTNIVLDNYHRPFIGYTTTINSDNTATIAASGLTGTTTIDSVAMNITPSAGSIDVSIDTWNTSGTYYKKWTEIGSLPGITTSHTIGNLKANTYYTVKVDGATFDTYQSDSSGQITFTYNGGYSTKTFEIEEHVPPNKPENLLVEGQVSPQHLTTFTPTFSFRYTDNDNYNSSMAHIRVGTSAGDNSMWDNQQAKNVENNATISITYAGTALQREVQYYWRVRVQDNTGCWSDWSSDENFKLILAWRQTTWIGRQTTPTLQVGTWNDNYDNYYTGENENSADNELKIAQASVPSWWNTSWTRRRSITITNSHTENYHLKIIVPYDSDMRSNYGDLRFTENDNAGVLNYWIENYTADNATVWVKRVENVDSTIYTYYGNPSASSADNWENTILPYVDSQATDNASWNARKRHTSVVFDDKMWVIGGRDYNNNLKNDVWCSSDGTTWIQVTDNASWAAREHHTSVVFDDKMWVIGGWDGAASYENDVWYSSDGENWFQATEAAGWAGREAHASIVFDNKMWIMGGIAPPYKNDVWYSSDGENWFQATEAAEWDAREAPTSIVFDNKMWVIGGYTNKFRSDVWYSSDGENWFQATEASEWVGREFHTSDVFDNKMWIMGGIISVSPPTKANDVWYSSDGENWFQATADAGWTARYDQSSVVFDDKMWIMGGNSDASLFANDVWRLLRSYVSPEPTVSVGAEQAQLHYYPVAYIESSIYDAGANANWKLVNWNENRPTGTSITVKVRSGNDDNPYDGGWSDWCVHDNNTENASLPNNRYVQYRVELTSSSDNSRIPMLQDIIISYGFPPTQPTLFWPENGTLTSDNTITFIWTNATYADNHRLLVDNDDDFSSPEIDNTIMVPDNSFAYLVELPNDTYYWRVTAQNFFGDNTSATWNFTKRNSWKQITWVDGQTTPDLQVGTWDNTYDNYYIGENENNADNELKIALDEVSVTFGIRGMGTQVDNYQVKFYINYDSRMQSDFSDIRFYDNDNTPLSFFIDNVNLGANCIAYVRVPQIPASDNRTIYMHFGNTTGAGSNGASTFVFYENVDDGDISDWTKYGTGILTAVQDGTNWVIQKGTASDPNGGWKAFGENIENFEVILKTLKTTGSGVGVATRWALENTSYYGYGVTCPSFADTSQRENIEKRVAGTGSSFGVGASSTYTGHRDVWYKVTFRKAGTNFYADLIDENNATIATVTAENNLYNNFSIFAIRGGAVATYYDNIIVRKYHENDRTYIYPDNEVSEDNLYYPGAYIESSIYDATKNADWKNVVWSENKPTGTNIIIKVRTGSDNDPYDGGWSDWCIHDNNTENASLSNNRYVQYRVELTSSSDNSQTPMLQDITIYYQFLPLQPTLISPADGTIMNDNTPTFVWTIGTFAYNHRLLVDNDPDFSSPEENQLLSASATTCTIADENALPDDNYSWKVVATSAVLENDSSVWTFVVDTVPPSAPTIVSPVDGENVNDNTPTISWSAVSDSSLPVLYRVWIDNNSDFSSPENDSGWINATNYTSGALLDNSYYLRVRAKDNAGNVGENSQRTFRVDTLALVAPTITYPADGENTNDNTPTITWNAVNDNSLPVLYRVWIDNDSNFSSPENDSSWISDTSYTPSALQNNLYYLRVRAKDNAGNVGENAQRTFRVDTLAPVAPTIISPADGENTNDNTPTITWNAVSDNSTPVLYCVVIDNDSDFSSPENDSGWINVTNYTSGALLDNLYYLRVGAKDNAGNIGENSQRTFRVDTLAPVATTITAPADGENTNDNTPTITWNAVSDNSTPVLYCVVIDNDSDFSSPENDSGWINVTNYTPGALLDNLYYLQVRAKDNAGNIGENSQRTFRIDTLAPTAPIITAPADGENTNDNTPTITWNAVSENSPPVLYQVIIDNNSDFSSPENDSGWISGTSYTPSALQDNLYYLRVGARDNAGNVGENSQRTFRVDTLALVAPTITYPADGENTNDNTPTITWNAVNDNSLPVLYRVWIDNNSDFSSPENDSGWIDTLTYTAGYLQDNLYYLRVAAKDNAGNQGDNSQLSFRVDTLKPAAPILYTPENNSTIATSTPTFSWQSIIDNTGVTYQLVIDEDLNFMSPIYDKSGILENQHTIENTLTNVTYYWRVRAVDGATNVGDWASSFKFTIRVVSPSPPSTAPSFRIVVIPTSGSVQQSGMITVTVSVIALDGYNRVVTLSAGQPWGISISFSPSSGVPDFSSAMTIEVDSATVGNYWIPIQAVGTDGIQKSLNYALSVTVVESIIVPPPAPLPIVLPVSTLLVFIGSLVSVGGLGSITFYLRYFRLIPPIISLKRLRHIRPFLAEHLKPQMIVPAISIANLMPVPIKLAPAAPTRSPKPVPITTPRSVVRRKIEPRMMESEILGDLKRLPKHVEAGVSFKRLKERILESVEPTDAIDYLKKATKPIEPAIPIDRLKYVERIVSPAVVPKLKKVRHIKPRISIAKLNHIKQKKPARRPAKKVVEHVEPGISLDKLKKMLKA